MFQKIPFFKCQFTRKIPSQTISLRIINEKQGSTAGEIHSSKEMYPQLIPSISIYS